MSLFEKIDQVPDFGSVCNHFLQGRNGIFKFQTGFIDNFVGFFNLAYRVLAKPLPFQSDSIDAVRLGRLASNQHIRRYVPGDKTSHCGKTVLAYFAKLMDQSEATEYGKVFNQHMACNRSGIGHDDMVADYAVVGDMGVGH